MNPIQKAVAKLFGRTAKSKVRKYSGISKLERRILKHQGRTEKFQSYFPGLKALRLTQAVYLRATQILANERQGRLTGIIEVTQESSNGSNPQA